MLRPRETFFSQFRSVKMYGTSVGIILLFVGIATVCGECPTIVTRSQWGARAPKEAYTPLSIKPAPFIVIHHADSPPCTNQAICQAKVRSFQNYHMDTKGWSDIGYNFLIGEDGNVYEGRGWDNRGAHTVPYNSKSIGICFIGNFTVRTPGVAAVNTAKSLIDCGISTGKIKGTYGLLGHRQAAQTSCPGNKLFDTLKSWPHWLSNP